MKQTIYGLYKRAFVNEEGQMTDEIKMTHHTDINEIYWFKGKHNYTDEDYFICEIEEVNGEWQQIEGTYEYYN
jgi:hypothetical protein